MRVLVLLLSCIALTVTQDALLGRFEQIVFEGMKGLSDQMKNLLSEDGTNFNSQLKAYLAVLDSQFCPMESSECEPAMNWLFGCNCRAGFRELGECKKTPCQLFKYFKENGAGIMSKFISSDSYEERYQIVMSGVVEPVSRAICTCTGVIGATINCVQNYDGSVFEVAGVGKDGGAKFDYLRENLDWDTLRTILLGFVRAGCGERNGKDCVSEISKMFTIGGTMLDNTFAGEDVCLSILRFEEEFAKYLLAVSAPGSDLETESYDDIDVSHIANNVMDALLNMQKEALCEPACAAEVMDSFYSCCAKRYFKVLSSESMRKAYNRMFVNVWTAFIFPETQAPDLSKAFKKYLSMLDLETFCGKRTDVYRKKNQQCKAINA